MLKGEKIYLRQIEMEDINLLLLWENDAKNWRYSESEAPYSMYEIKMYVQTASQVRENRQLRLIICKIDTNEAIGAVDLFNIDFKNTRAEIGILIAEEENRQQGFALEALMLIEKFALKNLALEQLHCDVQSTNKASIQLFERAGFKHNGTKKDWYKFKDEKLDSYFYQKFI